MMRVTLIDNYDSFTFNVLHAIGSLGATVHVLRNDKTSVDEVLDQKPDAVVISPGPCTPKEAGISCELIRRGGASVPMLGICLGLQAMGEVYGGSVVRAPVPVHGKVNRISHSGSSVFRGLNGPINATRYHSLVVERSSLPADLSITAESEDGLIMGLAHNVHPVHGVQFHPESIASEHGPTLFANFLTLAKEWNEQNRQAELRRAG
ncbi:anthranilate synthase component II [Terrihabitans sp. B22-R8]|uniref:anthranilate synthase component II n=1 Tax=Terrihabitans sp. B22-R8 TaxID=3425128 RepID=UPI00403C0C26